MIDQVQLDFDPSSLFALNVILGLVMFGIALELTIDDFKRVVSEPRAVIVGLMGQLLLLPAMTFVLIMALDPHPSIALGMILVAACPGGNMSNFFTHLSRGNSGLSISMTSVVTLTAVFATPFNVAFWGSQIPSTAAILSEVHVDPVKMVTIIALLLAVPIVLGMSVRRKWPEAAKRWAKRFKIFSLVAFAAFVVIALGKNFDPFLEHIDKVFFLVLLHNGVALALGYVLASISGLEERDRRAITIEVGIQNSGLGLVLIFNFFAGLGGMAVIAAWWGVWHLVAGLILGGYWSRIEPVDTQQPQQQIAKS